MDLDNWLLLMEKNKQADIPMDFDGKIMTPRDFVGRAKSNALPLSRAGREGSIFGMQALLIDRIKKRYQAGKLEGVHRLADEKQIYFSPEDIICEVEAGTPIGEKFLMVEKGLMDELKGMLRR
jgi:hypothetical protein